eukprot:g3146.t1
MGNSSSSNAQYRAAIERMQTIVPDCSAEMKLISDIMNESEGKRKGLKAAYKKLEECTDRRSRQLRIIEEYCGPSQQEFALCVDREGAKSSAKCMQTLTKFLNCAENAKRRKVIT